MKYSSINILNPEHNFKYALEYIDNIEYTTSEYSYIKKENEIYFNSSNISYMHNNNIWSSIDNELSSNKDYIPEDINISSLNLYFPEYSVDTYEDNVEYALTINTWINDKKIYLGSYILRRNDAIAADCIKTFYNRHYYEMINVNFIDPWHLMYSDEWKEFRTNICGVESEDDIEYNNIGSVINITLYPVVKSGNAYIKYEKYNGGQTAINLTNNDKVDLIKYNLYFDKQHSPGVKFIGDIVYNSSYKQDLSGLKQYLIETYEIDPTININIRYDFYIQDNNDVYDYFSFDSNNIDCVLNKKDFINSNIFGVTDKSDNAWNRYIDGLYITSTANIINTDLDEDDEDNIIMTIMSNKIFITKEIFKYLITESEYSLDFIKLNLIDMNVYNINTVNKIEQKVVQIDHPKDYKSNIIKPVYYRTRDLVNVIFHPEITENICINLDAYKATVDYFILRIEGVNFIEKARTPNGVIFRIVGNSLPKINNTGVYYILNQDSELITTGKYTYES